MARHGQLGAGESPGLRERLTARREERGSAGGVKDNTAIMGLRIEP